MAKEKKALMVRFSSLHCWLRAMFVRHLILLKEFDLPLPEPHDRPFTSQYLNAIFSLSNIRINTKEHPC
jgi:hypothetical protein